MDQHIRFQDRYRCQLSSRCGNAMNPVRLRLLISADENRAVRTPVTAEDRSLDGGNRLYLAAAQIDAPESGPGHERDFLPIGRPDGWRRSHRSFGAREWPHDTGRERSDPDGSHAFRSRRDEREVGSIGRERKTLDRGETWNRQLQQPARRRCRVRSRGSPERHRSDDQPGRDRGAYQRHPSSGGVGEETAPPQLAPRLLRSTAAHRAGLPHSAIVRPDREPGTCGRPGREARLLPAPQPMAPVVPAPGSPRPSRPASDRRTRGRR